jgi:hypothetical protein
MEKIYRHSHLGGYPPSRPHWIMWVILFVGVFAGCFACVTKASGQNQFISKPIGIITGVTGDIWHIHQGYNSENTPVTIQVRPKMYLIGEVIPCVAISNMGSVNYRAAMPGETPMEDICLGQKWPEDEQPVIWAEPIGKVMQTGQELYRVELSNGQIVILVWDGIYGLRDGQEVFICVCEDGGKGYYKIASPANPCSIQGNIRSKSWIRPVIKRT